jgi:putative ABC transport system permease protein
MLFGETLVIAVQSIRGNLFRASLTTLGIVIGVAAVITMVALGTGARAAIDEQMEALGGDILSINSSSWFSRGVARQTNTLTTADARALAIDGRHLGGVVPEINGRQQVKYGNRNLNVTIIGTTPNYPEVHHFNLAAGRMFTEADDSARRRVAVLGSEIPGMLDADAASLLGRTLQIRSISFEVIGILGSKGSWGWRNPDDDIWVPLSTAQFRVTGNDLVETISARVRGFATGRPSSRPCSTSNASCGANMVCCPAPITTSRFSTASSSWTRGRRRPRSLPTCLPVLPASASSSAASAS